MIAGNAAGNDELSPHRALPWPANRKPQHTRPVSDHRRIANRRLKQMARQGRIASRELYSAAAHLSISNSISLLGFPVSTSCAAPHCRGLMAKRPLSRYGRVCRRICPPSLSLINSVLYVRTLGALIGSRQMPKLAELGETFLVQEGASNQRPLSKTIKSYSSTRTVMLPGGHRIHIVERAAFERAIRAAMRNQT